VFAGVLAGGCGGGDERALLDLLARDRQAHLGLDAAAIADHVADTLVSVSDGRIDRQSRAEVEAFFRGYFRGATYEAWDDLEPPVIRIAPGGRMAWVIRRVHARRMQPGLGGDTLRREFVSAWTATYEKHGGRWWMTTVASTFVPPETRADRILAAARRHVGGRVPGGITAHARATGPAPPFEVTVHSARDGRARIDFDGGMSAAIGGEARWMRTAAAGPSPLPREMETFLRGHEIHMNLVAPETRYGPLHAAGAATFAGVPAWTLMGFDALGSPATFYYAQADTSPLGYRVADHATGRGPVDVACRDWADVDGMRLPRRAVFRQGAEVFTYAFTDVVVAAPPDDSTFARPTP